MWIRTIVRPELKARAYTRKTMPAQRWLGCSFAEKTRNSPALHRAAKEHRQDGPLGASP